ncbi:MAG: GTP cyclohydrolase II [candidate division WOR-3 bacterium]|nr:GTP cyclohydrolase II [candidate division WOR-3 bacterium]MCX7947001.1 GTP cyclohydrolase II [candidate division WOR-3 bacterium]MDW8149958.1 GTP cyclohydrolase II [candidate division WOR-3 bacterium]
MKFEAQASLPTIFGEFTIRVYSEGGKEHIALIMGEVGDNILVRVHSQCITGDTFGSLRCDCGAQLKYALEKISSEGRGILIYLNQEGRGIGLINKVKAYYLQDLGYDTVLANHQLGFEADLRNYKVACEILKDIGVKKVRLMTNNPQKIKHLSICGIEIVERIPVYVKANKYNKNYILTKIKKMGHLIDEKEIM